MARDSLRSVRVRRVGSGEYAATNVRGGQISFGDGSDETAFTPVELLLTALAGCSAVDVDTLTSRRAEPTRFEIEASADKVRTADGNRLESIEVTFTVTFPAGDAGDAARAMLPRAAQISHDRLCTVSRTVELGSPVTLRIEQ